MTRQLKRFGFQFAFILLVVFLSNSCSKNEVKPAATTPVPAEIEPPILNTSIVESISPNQGGAIDVLGIATVKLYQGYDHQTVIDHVVYRTIIDTLILTGANTTLSWNSDKTQASFQHTEAFAPKTKLTVRISLHWETVQGGAWKPVNWNNAVVRETKSSTFTVSDNFTIDASNIQNSYPIANQYHFLPKEHPKGFLKLIEGQSYLFGDAGFETYAEFKTPSTTLTQPLSYDVANKQINYSIPDGLLNETIYTLLFKRKNKSTGEVSVLYQYAFRTSKFNTFAEKVASFDLSATVLRGIFILWRVDYLKQTFTSAEYFDDFEMETKTDELKNIGSPPIPYATNLIQFSAILSGNDWFDNQINPMLYAPWTDPNFKPTIKSRDTTLVGLKPKKAMSIQGVAGGKLTADQITSNSAPAITGQSPYLLYHLCAYLDNDFLEIQQQVANKYLNQTGPAPAREDKIIWSQFPIMTKGNYYYKIIYKLPDGTVTSSVTLFMYNPIG